MTKAITSKELRIRFPWVKDQVDKGVRFVVYYRSKPLFDITPFEVSSEKKKPSLHDWKKLIYHRKDRKPFSAVELIRKDREE